MGNIICGILVNQLPDLKAYETPATNKIKSTKKSISSFSPKNLTIGFKEDCSCIFLDMIFYKNLSEEETLTILEKDINGIFPNSKFIVIAINETSDIIGYSLVENGVKLRTKVIAKGSPFLDYGELNEKENVLYNSIQKILDSQPNTKKIVEDKFSHLDNISKKKHYLRYRDALYKRLEEENRYNYSNGTLDAYIIEGEIAKFIKSDIADLEKLEVIEFEKKKIDFKKESLKEYLFLSYKELLGHRASL